MMENVIRGQRNELCRLEAELYKKGQIIADLERRSAADLQHAKCELHCMRKAYSEQMEKSRETVAVLQTARRQLEISEITVIENSKKIAEMERELAAKNKRCAEMELSTADLRNLLLEERRKNRDLAESLSKLRGLNEAGKSKENPTKDKNAIKTIEPQPKARVPRAPLAEVQNIEEPPKSRYNLRRRL